MPDERQDSIKQGIHAPEESPIGQAAAEERRQRAAEGPEIGGAMGGTSDSERAGEEAHAEPRRGDTTRASGADTARYQDMPEDRVGG